MVAKANRFSGTQAGDVWGSVLAHTAPSTCRCIGPVSPTGRPHCRGCGEPRGVCAIYDRGVVSVAQAPDGRHARMIMRMWLRRTPGLSHVRQGRPARTQQLVTFRRRWQTAGGCARGTTGRHTRA